MVSGSNATTAHRDVLPPRKNNAITLKIWNPLYKSEPNNKTEPKEDQFKTYTAILDTGNALRYPIITKNVYTELKSINVLQSDVNLQESATSIKAINNALYKPKDLILKRPLTFLTDVGSKVTFHRFYVQDASLSDINIGRYKLSELGTKWDLTKKFVYFGANKIPLKSYE